jgi:diguanylate cyclase
VGDKIAGTDEWLESLNALAEELNAIPSGAAFHDQLTEILEDWQSSRAEVDNTYTILLSFFLGMLSDKGVSTDVALLTSQMIQARASSPRSGMSAVPPAHRRPAKGSSAPSVSDDRPGTILESIHQDNASAPINTEMVDRRQPPTPTERSTRTRAEDELAETEATGEPAEKAVPSYPEVERRVNSAYRLHLDRKHGEIEKLQEVLAQKAMEAIAQNKEFGALLEIERAALQQANSITEIENMKEILIGGTEELIEGQRTLAEKLRSSYEYLQLIKSDSERLHDELNKVRLLSLTDEYTGLPNRRAFMRRMEDEIGRVQRYGTPLTLVLIDLDSFKNINDRYGHPAGDAVLTWYAHNALPTFRHYDMVARYGGEEFAVLFPNTTSEGAMKALQKMRERIDNARVEYDGFEIEVPTFSAGLTTYQVGDTKSTLIKRADKALYLAKNGGRDRVEVKLPNHIQENATSGLESK